MGSNAPPQALGTRHLLRVKCRHFICQARHLLGVPMTCLLPHSTGRELGPQEPALVATWDGGSGFSRAHPGSLSRWLRSRGPPGQTAPHRLAPPMSPSCGPPSFRGNRCFLRPVETRLMTGTQANGWASDPGFAPPSARAVSKPICCPVWGSGTLPPAVPAPVVQGDWA